MTLLFATTNPNKLKEARAALPGIEFLSLADVPPIPEPDESGATFWENARIKALAYAHATGQRVVAEDSGLEIDALGGEPGVYSARFLRADATYPERFSEIYRRLDGRPSAARFVTALAVAEGHEILFETETVIEGTIAAAPAGANGFGYDPIFRYLPFARTTAELSEADKSAVSHRARAFRDLQTWLTTRKT
jgi:XTP/dITP diphosphohydrolase